MGKATGFMEFARENNPAESPTERIKNFNEFHPMLNKVERTRQAARCMDCGVPFCTSGISLGGAFTGCPLHNMPPEWNDLIYNDCWEQAYARLRKTNNFPEFTGRVCPALCEAACTCGRYGDSVTCRENELAIVENAYSSGIAAAKPPRVRSGKRVAVVGSGPSGLAAADQLNHRGHEVTVFERSDRPGGLLMYGIPNMKLEKRIIQRRTDIMTEEGVVFQTNTDVGRDVPAGELLEHYDAVVLCCGSSQPRDLNLPGRDADGIYFAVDFLRSTTKALLDGGDFISAKGKNVVIVGGGDTGNDCVGTSIRHGCASVTQIEMMPKAPDTRLESNPWPQWPRVCKTDYGQQEAIAVFGHDPRIYETTVKEFIKDDSGKLCAIKLVKLRPERDEATGRTNMVEIPGSESVMDCDLLLIAAGFLGCQSYVADAFGVNVGPRGTAGTPDVHETNVDRVFTAGDMHRGQSLVVWAIAEGRAAAMAVDKYLMGYTNLV